MIDALSRLLLARLGPAETELQKAVIGLVWHIGSHGVCTPAQLARATASMELGPRLRLLGLIDGVVAQGAGPPEARAWLSSFVELARCGPDAGTPTPGRPPVDDVIDVGR